MRRWATSFSSDWKSLSAQHMGCNFTKTLAQRSIRWGVAFYSTYSLQRASSASSRLILTTQFPERRLRLSEITRLVPSPLVNGRMEGTLLSWSRAVAGRCIPVCSGTACRLPGAEQEETGTEGTAVGRRIPGGKWIPWPSDSIHPPHSLPLPNLPPRFVS